MWISTFSGFRFASPEAAGSTHRPATSIRVVAPRSASIVRWPPAALQSHPSATHRRRPHSATETEARRHGQRPTPAPFYLLNDQYYSTRPALCIKMTGYSESVRYNLNGSLRYFAWSHTKMIWEHLLNCALKLTKFVVQWKEWKLGSWWSGLESQSCHLRILCLHSDRW